MLSFGSDPIPSILATRNPSRFYAADLPVSPGRKTQGIHTGRETIQNGQTQDEQAIQGRLVALPLRPGGRIGFHGPGRTSGRPAPSCNTTSAPRCAGAPAGMDWLRTQPVPLNATRSPSRSSR